MMQLQNKIAELLESGKIALAIGFQSGINNEPIPCFAENANQCKQLIFTASCKNNLAVYLHKPEVIQAKKVGIIGNVPTLRSILQLLSENQLWKLELTFITVSDKDEVIVFENVQALETYVEAHFPEFTDEDLKQLAYINSLSRDERWEYWQGQFSICTKCYVCRAVCPMCYCPQCTVEQNQPQWIKVSADTSGNREWHTMRAMHLAGRCVNCGECGRLCPVGIPVHLLTTKMNQDISKEFGVKTGYSATGKYALNTFDPNDKDGFIR